MFFGSRYHYQPFMASVRDRALARNYLQFPNHRAVEAHSARATAASLNLNRFYWEPALAVGVFLSANAFVSRSEGNVTQLPRGQSSEMVPPWVQLRSRCYRQHLGLYDFKLYHPARCKKKRHTTTSTRPFRHTEIRTFTTVSYLQTCASERRMRAREVYTKRLECQWRRWRRLGPGFREATSAARDWSDREQRARFHKAGSTERGGSSSALPWGRTSCARASGMWVSPPLAWGGALSASVANAIFQMPCDPTPVGSVGACDVMYNDVVM